MERRALPPSVQDQTLSKNGRGKCMTLDTWQREVVQRRRTSNPNVRNVVEAIEAQPHKPLLS